MIQCMMESVRSKVIVGDCPFMQCCTIPLPLNVDIIYNFIIREQSHFLKVANLSEKALELMKGSQSNDLVHVKK